MSITSELEIVGNNTNNDRKTDRIILIHTALRVRDWRGLVPTKGGTGAQQSPEKPGPTGHAQIKNSKY
jgi:hypothetical protein